MKWATIEQEYYFYNCNCRKLSECANCIFNGEPYCALFNIYNEEDLLAYNEGILKYWNEHKK